MSLRAVLLLCCISCALAGKCDADENNGFAMSECGSEGDAGYSCCHPKRQVCLSGTPKDGKETFACSSNRALYGMKVVKVIIIPALSLVFLVFLLVTMLRVLKGMQPKPALSILCILQVVCAAIVVMSTMWKFALYSAFLSAAVFYFMKEKANKWVIIALVTLQFFNVVAINGVVDKANGVFIPMGFLAADNVPSWEKGILDKIPAGAACSAAYDNYYSLEDVELKNEGSDSQEKYHGVCTADWLGVVGGFVTAKMVIQFIMTVLSLRMLVPNLVDGSAEGELKQMA